jgi:hypothetical protein
MIMNEPKEQAKGLTLIVARHGHTQPARYGENDRETALTEKGREHGAAIGCFLKEQGYEPDAVILAGCKRVVETFETMQLDNLEGRVFKGEYGKSRIEEDGFFSIVDVFGSDKYDDDDLYFGDKDDILTAFQMSDNRKETQGAKTILYTGRRPQIPEFVEMIGPNGTTPIPSKEYDHGTICVLNFPNINKWVDLWKSETGYAESTLRIFQPDDKGRVVELTYNGDVIEFIEQDPEEFEVTSSIPALG